MKWSDASKRARVPKKLKSPCPKWAAWATTAGWEWVEWEWAEWELAGMIFDLTLPRIQNQKTLAIACESFFCNQLLRRQPRYLVSAATCFSNASPSAGSPPLMSKET